MVHVHLIVNCSFYISVIPSKAKPTRDMSWPFNSIRLPVAFGEVSIELVGPEKTPVGAGSVTGLLLPLG